MRLNDYKRILRMYEQKIPTRESDIKKRAHDIITKKLCSCIEKVTDKTGNESDAVAICTSSLFQKRNLDRGSFNCSGKPRVDLYRS